jgi:iron complex outermembrane receptor protein
VLYGNGSPGGVIDMVSKRPLAEPFNEVFTSFGNYGMMVGGFDTTGAIDPDGKLLYRLVGLGRDYGTQVNFTEYQRGTIAPSLTWRPTEDTTWTILAQYQDDPKAGFFNQLPVAGTALYNPHGKISTSFYSGEPTYDKYERTQDSVESLFEHRFSDAFTVRQNFRYMDVHANVNLVYPTSLQSNQVLANRSIFTTTENLWYMTADNQAEVKLFTGPLKHTILGGADYQSVLDTKVNGGGTVAPINVFDPVYGVPVPYAPINLSQKQIQNQEGYYVQDQVQLGRLFGTFSIRQDHLGTVTENILTQKAVEAADEATTRRGGLLYLFDGGLAPYVQYTQSFQPTIGTSFNGTPFKPTTGQQKEAGLKWEPPGTEKILATFAAFDLVQQNSLTVDPAHPLFQVQLGAVRSRGLEFEAKATLTEGLNLIGSYTYLDQYVMQANDGSVGRRVAGIPQDMAALWGDYTFQHGWLAGFGAAAGSRYLGPSAGNTLNTFYIPGVTLYDAGIHYDFEYLAPALKGLNFALNAQNLLDTVYVQSCITNGCYYGLRRQVIGTLRYRW